MDDLDELLEPRLSMGANHPPAEDAFALRVEQLVAATNAWASNVPKITDLDTSKKCRDFIAQVTEEWDALESERKAQKKPHDDAAAAVQARFSPLLRRLQVAKDLLKGKLGTWLDFEDARLKREKREKEEAALKAMQEAEDAKRAAEAPTGNAVETIIAAEEAETRAQAALSAAQTAAQAKPQAHGDFAARAIGYRTVWSAEITDPVKALTHYANHAKIRDALQSVADAEVRAMKERSNIPGVRAKTERRVA